jgi:hypothetical protein
MAEKEKKRLKEDFVIAVMGNRREQWLMIFMSVM